MVIERMKIVLVAALCVISGMWSHLHSLTHIGYILHVSVVAGASRLPNDTASIQISSSLYCFI